MNQPLPAVAIRSLSVRYENTSALTDISFSVADGDYLGIIGPNGGGKTTLLKSILGLIPVEVGHIEVYGHEPGTAKKLIGYVPQITMLNHRFPITVRQVVLTGKLPEGLPLLHRYTIEDRKRADELLHQVGIAHLADRQIGQLSGGEFQRMLIARALAVEPKLLLLDEPTASVDPRSRTQIFELLQELNRRMTIILVTHDLMAVSSYVTSMACINTQLVYHGASEINDTILEQLYGCSFANNVPSNFSKQRKAVGE